MRKTAMQNLKDDLVDTKITTSETFSEIQDEKLRKVIENFVQTTLDTIIERIDDELLEMERKNMLKCIDDAQKTNFWVNFESHEDYFTKTFTDELP
mgnify:CR=1 FL=1